MTYQLITSVKDVGLRHIPMVAKTFGVNRMGRTGETAIRAANPFVSS